MARTNDALIGAVFDIDTTIISDTTLFIAAANRLVTQLCSTDNYDATELQEIETWLAAHFCSVKQKIARTEKIDVLSETFEGVTKMHLQSSLYGQTALVLDWAGGLASWNSSSIKGNKRTAGISFIGKTKDEYLGIDED